MVITYELYSVVFQVWLWL